MTRFDSFHVAELTECELVSVNGGADCGCQGTFAYRVGQAVGDAVEAAGNAYNSAKETVSGWFS